MESVVLGQQQRSRRFMCLIERRCFAPITLDNDDDDLDIVESSLLYHKMPPQELSLSVLKLDGSVFDVNVSTNATVRELRQAIEEVFCYSPEEGQGLISWSHVWGHFCLCFEGQKLVNDKTNVRNLGIKDGDQLQFIRHMSVNFSYLKRSNSRGRSKYKPCSSDSNAHEKKEQDGRDASDENESQGENFKYFGYENQEDFPMQESKLGHFLRGWLSYSRLQGVSRKGSVSRSRSSKFSSFRRSPRMLDR